MNRYPFLSCIFLLALALQARPQGPSRDEAQPVDGFAATVAGRIVTVGDVIDSIRPALRQLNQRHSGAELVREQTKLFETGLDRLIERKLMLAHFEKMEAQLPPGTVRERTETILRERFDNDRAKLLSVLRQVGKSEQEWENEIRDQIIGQSMISQFVSQQVNVSPREIREAYERRKGELAKDVELKLRAIAFRPASGDGAEAKQQKIEKVRRRLQRGDDFADVAREVSEGPGASQGGDQGWVELDRLPEPLSSALADRREGDITELIETPVQSYFFLVEERRGGDVMPLAEAQPLLESEIRQEKYDRIYENWISGLRNDFPVKRFNPDISAVTGER